MLGCINTTFAIPCKKHKVGKLRDTPAAQSVRLVYICNSVSCGKPTLSHGALPHGLPTRQLFKKEKLGVSSCCHCQSARKTVLFFYTRSWWRMRHVLHWKEDNSLVSKTARLALASSTLSVLINMCVMLRPK